LARDVAGGSSGNQQAICKPASDREVTGRETLSNGVRTTPERLSAMAFISTNGNGKNSVFGISVAHSDPTPAERLRIATDVASGVCDYVPTKQDLAKLLRVHPSQISRELKERQALREQQEARARDVERKMVEDLVRHWQAAPDTVLDRAVREIGIARVYDVIDRLTK
jgi:hypothetical protein